MKVQASLPVHASLKTTDARLWDLLSQKNPSEQNEKLVALGELERLFDLLAALSMGRPAASAGIPSDACFAAALLLLREMMHHLNFSSIQVLKS
jgi:hypothetical protein